ncbi:hypothetical protein [Halorussus marinus]|uniref:hypothetical protein n=1 Tax=Halorussus marinus TaxID=2505976 RepID=UPI0010919EA9|nr:hypothetical protein [Halorussus marinus]
MCEKTTDELETLENLDARDVRALTEHLLPHAVGGGVYEIYSEEGTRYEVDHIEGRCTCPDYQHRSPEGGCKHVRRVQFWTGARDAQLGAVLDAADDERAFDERLIARFDERRARVEAAVAATAETGAVATDGGRVTVEGDD